MTNFQGNEINLEHKSLMKENQQAGAKQCQAQLKLRLTKPFSQEISRKPDYPQITRLCLI
jgi:hypothetical protein